MIGLKVEMEGIQELVFGLRNFGNDISLLTEPLEDSGMYMRQQAIMNFPASGSLMQSGGWPPLAESTIKKKARDWPGAPMMVRTGKLRDSFRVDGPRIGKDYGEIEVYNPVHYAIEHQEAWGLLPQRILLRFQKQQIQDITNIFTRWIGRIINKSFK